MFNITIPVPLEEEEEEELPLDEEIDAAAVEEVGALEYIVQRKERVEKETEGGDTHIQCESNAG